MASLHGCCSQLSRRVQHGDDEGVFCGKFQQRNASGPLVLRPKHAVIVPTENREPVAMLRALREAWNVFKTFGNEELRILERRHELMQERLANYRKRQALREADLAKLIDSMTQSLRESEAAGVRRDATAVRMFDQHGVSDGCSQPHACRKR